MAYTDFDLSLAMSIVSGNQGGLDTPRRNGGSAGFWFPSVMFKGGSAGCSLLGVNKVSVIEREL